jgi:hypothetical protein
VTSRYRGTDKLGLSFFCVASFNGALHLCTVTVWWFGDFNEIINPEKIGRMSFRVQNDRHFRAVVFVGDDLGNFELGT